MAVYDGKGGVVFLAEHLQGFICSFDQTIMIKRFTSTDMGQFGLTKRLFAFKQVCCKKSIKTIYSGVAPRVLDVICEQIARRPEGHPAIQTLLRTRLSACEKCDYNLYPDGLDNFLCDSCTKMKFLWRSDMHMILLLIVARM